VDDELRSTVAQSLKEFKASTKWVNSVVVIVCVMLGQKSVDPVYLDVIEMFFKLKINVGILGGRPGEAYYLIGLQEGYLIFLDPHTIQEAVDPSEIRQQHTTYHESSAKKIHFTKLDPALGFTFLLTCENDYKRLCDFMKKGKERHGKNWIFHTMETKPDYMRSKPKPKRKNMPKVVHDFDSEEFKHLEPVGLDEFKPM
jgi:hypothetical protein